MEKASPTNLSQTDDEMGLADQLRSLFLPRNKRFCDELTQVGTFDFVLQVGKSQNRQKRDFAFP